MLMAPQVRSHHSGIMEKKAAEAERASIKYKQVEYLNTRIGETFRGIISGAVPRVLCSSNFTRTSVKVLFLKTYS